MVTIQNGKFYKDGKVVPVEFGNKEQAEAFEKASKYEKALKEGKELDYSSEVTYTATFKCFCGNRFYIDGTTSQEDGYDVLAGENLTCKCKKHKFITYMEDGCLMVKEVKL